jgi:hypothetical protein
MIESTFLFLNGIGEIPSGSSGARASDVDATNTPALICLIDSGKMHQPVHAAIEQALNGSMEVSRRP